MRDIYSPQFSDESAFSSGELSDYYIFPRADCYSTGLPRLSKDPVRKA
jgi:hypothetical protein